MNNMCKKDLYCSLDDRQKGLFILWANVKNNLQCSCEEELCDKLGEEKVNRLKHNYAEHILSKR